LAAAEVDSKVPDPTASEVNAYYLSQKDQYGKPLDEVRDQVRDTLKKLKIQQARQSYAKDLLAKAKARGAVVAFIGPKRMQVAVDPTRLKGSATAPVMIVEFADFSCPFCREAAATMRNLLTEYQGKVSLAYRDYPLSAIHPRAELAAEASRCAAEQGRFWEYHDALFANPEKQDRQNLLLDSHVLKLDEKRFESCLNGAKYKAQVDEDLQAANRAGVTATPGFFVNGIFVDGAQPTAVFEQIINAELAPADRRIVQQ
jgi:protein-disulfide isomerase